MIPRRNPVRAVRVRPNEPTPVIIPRRISQILDHIFNQTTVFENSQTDSPFNGCRFGFTSKTNCLLYCDGQISTLSRMLCFNHGDGEKIPNLEDNCPYCLENLNIKNVFRTQCCKKYFHVLCLREHYQKDRFMRCPTCRNGIEFIRGSPNYRKSYQRILDLYIEATAKYDQFEDEKYLNGFIVDYYRRLIQIRAGGIKQIIELEQSKAEKTNEEINQIMTEQHRILHNAISYHHSGIEPPNFW